jgi:importin subunit beta-1
METTLGPHHGLSTNQKYNLQMHLSSLAGSCVQRLESTDLSDELNDKIVGCILHVVSDTNSSALQDAYMTLGFLIDRLEGRYVRYMNHAMPCLMAALERYDDHVTCSTVVHVMGDVARAMGDKIVPHCDQLIQILIKILQANDAQNVIKPFVISLFSDVALAIGKDFVRYAETILNILGKAVDMAKLSTNQDDEDHDEFVFSIQEAIFEAYTGIIYAITESHEEDKYIAPHVDKILQFVTVACTAVGDDRPTSLTCAGINVIGDLLKIPSFRPRLKSVIQHQSIQVVLFNADNHEEEKVRESSRWVKHLASVP